MKCIIENQVVLSRPPEGPIAAQIGSFAKSMSEQGYSPVSIHRQVLLLHVLADGSSRQGSDCAASAPIILYGIYDIAHDMRDLAGEMLLPSGILSISCAGMA
jgi:hypothetical protein